MSGQTTMGAMTAAPPAARAAVPGAFRRRLPGRIVLLLVFGFLYLPIAVLVLLSFNDSGLPTSWSGFSTRWYVALAGNGDILRAAWNTLVVAVFATLISTVLGTLLALGMETRRRKSNGLEALAFAPMVIPDIVLAVALLSFFSRLNLTMGLHTIVISHVVFDLAGDEHDTLAQQAAEDVEAALAPAGLLDHDRHERTDDGIMREFALGTVGAAAVAEQVDHGSPHCVGPHMSRAMDRCSRALTDPSAER